MSVVMNFAIFPTQRAGSASPFVARVVEKVRELGFDSQLTSMGTIVETPTLPEALMVLEEAYRILEGDCDRVYLTASLDIRKGAMGRIQSKIHSVEAALANP